MKRVIVKQIQPNQIEWVNSRYNEIDFVKSNFENEFIVIAKVGNENAGLGRLVRIDEKNIELGGIYVLPSFRGLGVAESIVRSLCEENPFKEAAIWCLPFKNLLKFYAKFGFKKHERGKIPEEIMKKLEYCNSGDKYGKEVLLLFKND